MIIIGSEMLPYASFQTALSELHKFRGQPLTPFTELVGRSVYEGLLQSLQDYQEDNAILRVLPAPTGSGKTSCAIAFAAAMIRSGAGTVLIASNLVKNCEDIWKELAALCPVPAAYWSSETVLAEEHHGPGAKLAHISEARNYSALVITQQKFDQADRDDALYVHGGKRRSLIIVDERPEHAHVAQIKLTDAEIVHELAKDRLGLDREGEEGLLISNLAKLCSVLAKYSESLSGASLQEIELPQDTVTYLAKALRDTKLKHRLFDGDASWERLEELQGFCEGSANHCAFMACREKFSRDATFVGYRLKWPVLPGMAVLDATGEIDGLSKVYKNQRVLNVPQADYSQLTTVQLAAPDGLQLSKLKKAIKLVGERKELLKWLMQQIDRFTTADDQILIVSFKGLIDSPEFNTMKWGNRQVRATWFGRGIGSNEWRDCNVVFMIGEYWLPRSVSVGQTNAFKEVPAAGTLKEANGGDGLRGDFATISNGHLLRELKQMAMRGTGRNLDENGIAAPMRLYLLGHEKLMLAAQPLVFPNAPQMVYAEETQSIHNAGSQGRRGVTQDLMRLLTTTSSSFISSEDIKSALGFDLKNHIKKLTTDADFQAFLEAKDLEYQKGLGRGSKSGFRRKVSNSSNTTTE